MNNETNIKVSVEDLQEAMTLVDTKETKMEFEGKEITVTKMAYEWK